MRQSFGSAHHLRVARFCRDAAKRGLDSLHAVGLKIGDCVKRANELSGVESVAVVHYAPELLAELHRTPGHAWNEDAGEVGLDLVVDVVRRPMILRMGRRWRGDAASQVVARVRISAPETVARICEVYSRLADANIDAPRIERVDESHLDVEVVLAERLVYKLGLPDRQLIPIEELAVFPELGRPPVGDANGLANPSASHLVAVFGNGNGAHLLATYKKAAACAAYRCEHSGRQCNPC